MIYFRILSTYFLSALSALYYVHGVEFEKCETVYKQHVIDIDETMYECSKKMPSPDVVPSVYRDESDNYSPTIITAGIRIGALISVDDILNQATFNLYLRLQWNDPRWVLSNDVFNGTYLNPEATTIGIDILPLVKCIARPLILWTPNWYFQETIEFNVISERLMINQNGSFLWSQDLVVLTTQIGMSFRNFPLDTQTFTLTLGEFSLTSPLLLFGSDSYIAYINDPSTGSRKVDFNELWTFKKAFYQRTFYQYPSLPSSPSKPLSFVTYTLQFSRVSQGIILRLGMPVLIFLLVVGASFWADIKKRIDVTITVMLAVAALYLVIGDEIPNVGYMSTFDWFITTTFIILGVVVGLHCWSQMLNRKKEKYPVLRFEADLIIATCRTAWLPVIFGMFISFFDLKTVNAFIISLVFACILSFMYGVSALGSLKLSYDRLLNDIYYKVKSSNDGIGNDDISNKSKIKTTLCEKVIYQLCSSRIVDKDMGKNTEMTSIDRSNDKDQTHSTEKVKNPIANGLDDI